MKKATILVTLLYFCVQAEVLSPPDISSGQKQAPLTHEVRVVLKLVQVYVTDKKGNPVQNLGPSDFILFDNGQAVTVTEFEKHTLLAAATK